MTVLEKCGISNETIRKLKDKGLVIKEFRRYLNAHRSPSEEWIYLWADQFTPPLSEEEKQKYINNPKSFYQDLIKNTLIVRKLSGVLFNAYQNTKGLERGEALPVFLSILMLFQSGVDNNFYKYDRHLEYHNYEDSPVGYYWKQLTALCLLAGKKASPKDPDKWARQRFFDIISTPNKITLSLEYVKDCILVKKRLIKIIKNIDNLEPSDISIILKQNHKNVYKIINKKSEKFFMLPEEFIKLCLNYDEIKIDRSPLIIKKGEKTLLEIKIYLESDELINDLMKTIEAIGYFKLGQEKTSFIFHGITNKLGGHFIEPAILSFENIKRLLEKNPGFIQNKNKSQVKEILAEDPIIGSRRLIYEGEGYFIKDIKEKYREEIRRWL